MHGIRHHGSRYRSTIAVWVSYILVVDFIDGYIMWNVVHMKWLCISGMYSVGGKPAQDQVSRLESVNPMPGTELHTVRVLPRLQHRQWIGVTGVRLILVLSLSRQAEG